MPIDVDRLSRVYMFLNGFLNKDKKNDGASLELSDGTKLTRGSGLDPGSGGDAVDPNRANVIGYQDPDLLLGIEKPKDKLEELPAFPVTSGKPFEKSREGPRTDEEIQDIVDASTSYPQKTHPETPNEQDLRRRMVDLVAGTPANQVPLSRNRSSGQIDEFQESEGEGSILNISERKEEEEAKGETFAKRKTRRKISKSGKNKRATRRKNRK